jgi:hypothetical protein
MFGVKNTSDEILSIHTNEIDAITQIELFADASLVVVEDTEANLVAALKQE